MSYRHDCHEIRFAPNQKLPPGYRVEWWGSDEHYHWVLIDRPDDVYSVAACCRWMCWRGAWAHYRETVRPASREVA